MILQKTKVVFFDPDILNSSIFLKRLDKIGLKCEYFSESEVLFRFVSHYLEEDPENRVVAVVDFDFSPEEVDELVSSFRKKFDPFTLSIICFSKDEDDLTIAKVLGSKVNDYLVKPSSPQLVKARIDNQKRLIQLQSHLRLQSELNSITSMIVTLNHEINNPLAIAFGSFSCAFEKIDEKRHEKGVKALGRIRDIVKKISLIRSQQKLKTSKYVDGVNYFELD